jgi:hypothetical protein
MKKELIQAISILTELLYLQDHQLNKDSILQQVMAVAAPVSAPPVTTAVASPPVAAIEPPPTTAIAPPPGKVSVHQMTATATGTYEAMIAAGWDDEALIQHGHMTPPGGIVPGFIQPPPATA